MTELAYGIELMFAAPPGIDVLCSSEGKVEEVADFPHAVFVAILGEIYAAPGPEEADLGLDEVAHDNIVRRVQLNLAARDPSVVVEVQLQRLVRISADERHSVHAFQFKVGELAVQKA